MRHQCWRCSNDAGTDKGLLCPSCERVAFVGEFLHGLAVFLGAALLTLAIYAAFAVGGQ